MRKTLLAVLVTAAAFCSAAGAAELTGTLKKVADTGEITLGYRESSVPFSYLTNDGKPVGYATEICKKVAEAVKVAVKNPNLRVNYQPITSANRIPLLQNGTIDIECGSTTNSKERQKQAAFGTTYFVISVTAAVKKDSGINNLTDLKGKTVTMTSGTTAVPLLKNYAKEKGFKFRPLLTKDFAESMQLVAAGRASAFVIDDILLAGQIANLPHPENYKILTGKVNSLGVEPYGPMFRKDDPQFKALVDKTLADMMASGEMEALYKTWFTQPIPPKNINMNFPMNDMTRNAFKNPNSDGI